MCGDDLLFILRGDNYMKCFVYVDGSSNKKVGGVGYIATTEDLFLGRGGKQVKDTKISSLETIAIGLACHAILNDKLLEKIDDVTIFTDSYSAHEFISERRKTGESGHSDSAVTEALNKFFELSKRCVVRLIKIDGHQPCITGNSYADRLAKFMMRQVSA